MKRALVYSRVDPNDRTVMPAQRAAAEAICSAHGWRCVHFSDSASGKRPPLQFARGNQLIRPGLTRLISTIDSDDVVAVIPASDDALSTDPELGTKLEQLLLDKGFARHAEESLTVFERP